MIELEDVSIRFRELQLMIGTTVVYPHGDERLRAQEVGASIFVEANRHLVKAAKVGR
jgi:prenylcysteine oxidase/farnesylcysteine lyase